MSDGYSEKVMDHFANPRMLGDPDADGIGKVGNPVCGDVMWIYIKVKDNILEDVSSRHLAAGCDSHKQYDHRTCKRKDA